MIKIKSSAAYFPPDVLYLAEKYAYWIIIIQLTAQPIWKALKWRTLSYIHFPVYCLSAVNKASIGELL